MHANDISTYTNPLCTKLNTFKREELQKLGVEIYDDPQNCMQA